MLAGPRTSRRRSLASPQGARGRLAAADAKAFDGALSRRDESLAMFDRKLHELIAAAITENWTIMRKHNQRMAGILEQIIASGMAAGELHPGDAALAARLRQHRVHS